MKKAVTIYCLTILIYFANSFPSKANEILLETGTRIPLRLTSPISSAINTDGDIVIFTVDEDIKVEDITVIKEGAPAYGLVNDTMPAGRLGLPGYISINLDYLKAVNGKKIALTNSYSKKGQDKRFSAIFPAFIWPFALLTKGTEANFPKSYKIIARIDRDVFIEINKPEKAISPVKYLKN